MTDALVFSGIFLAIVLVTQIGRRRHYLVLALLPFVSCGVAGWVVAVAGTHHYAAGDLAAGGVGVLIGLLVGLGLTATMRVYRDGGRLYTRAGVAYLSIWLAVLLGRIAFVWLLLNVPDAARAVGRFLAENRIGTDGITLFFLLMALVMVLVRETGVLVRAYRGRPRLALQAG